MDDGPVWTKSVYEDATRQAENKIQRVMAGDAASTGGQATPAGKEKKKPKKEKVAAADVNMKMLGEE